MNTFDTSFDKFHVLTHLFGQLNLLQDKVPLSMIKTNAIIEKILNTKIVVAEQCKLSKVEFQ